MPYLKCTCQSPFICSLIPATSLLPGELSHILDRHFAVGPAQAYFHLAAFELSLRQLLEKGRNCARIAGQRHQPDNIAGGPLAGAQADLLVEVLRQSLVD